MEMMAIAILIGVALHFFLKHLAAKHTDQPEPSAQDWVQPFILYYTASEMYGCAEGTIPDTLWALATGRTNETHVQQSMLVALGTYLSFEYQRERQLDDWQLAKVAGRDFLQVEIRTLNSLVALRRYIRSISEPSTSETELSAQVTKWAAAIKADEDLGTRVRNMMLKNSVGELFAIRHGESFRTYLAKILAHQEAMMYDDTYDYKSLRSDT